MADETTRSVRRVCVTGAGGYIGSWLVKNLLQKGYTVHATLRDPRDEKKSRVLLEMAGAEDRLKLFKADLTEEGSFDSAVEFCEGVFHVAGPIDFTKDKLDDFVVPAVKGVLNVLKACTRANSVRRVVFTSSTGAASPLNEKGEIAKPCLDESCWTSLDIIQSKPSTIAMYFAAKTLAEKEALNYGASYGLDVVTIGTGLVVGPWITITPPLTSAQTILYLMGENDELSNFLAMADAILCSIPVVHIEDCCNAHIFLMEHPNPEGRYICWADSLRLKSLKDIFSRRYPQFKSGIKSEEERENVNGENDKYVPASSKKLVDMGFCFEYNLERILDDAVECVLSKGILQAQSSTSER